MTRHLIIIVFLFVLLGSSYTKAQTREVKIEYKVLEPIENTVYRSPQKIPVAFRIYNLGSDTIYATDSFEYSISHGLLDMQPPVVSFQAFNRMILPGDSTRIYRDTILVNWTADTMYQREFQLRLVCSGFRFVWGPRPLKVSFVENQSEKGKVNLIHRYRNVSVENVVSDHHVIVFPNPNNASTVSLQGINVNRETTFKLSNELGRDIPIEIIGTDVNIITLSTQKCVPGIYYLTIRSNNGISTHKITITP